MKTVSDAMMSTGGSDRDVVMTRSEEHTAELQSLVNLVCRLLPEKKKQKNIKKKLTYGISILLLTHLFK